MSLVSTQLRNTKPGLKPYKIADEKGLFLLVQPSGGMLWRFKYRIDGHDEDGSPKRVEKKLGLGTYPDVSLKEAREQRDEARKLLANGIDPAEQKQRDKRIIGFMIENHTHRALTDLRGKFIRRFVCHSPILLLS